MIISFLPFFSGIPVSFMGDLLIHSSFFLPPSLLPSYFSCFCFFHFLFCFLRFLKFCLPVLFEIFYFGCFPELVFILRIVLIMVSYYCVIHTIFLLCLSELLFKPFFEVLFCSLCCPPHSLWARAWLCPDEERVWGSDLLGCH